MSSNIFGIHFLLFGVEVDLEFSARIVQSIAGLTHTEGKFRVRIHLPT